MFYRSSLQKYLALLLFSFLTFLISCSEEESETVVVTEDVLYLSGETIRLTGRILTLSEGDITAHGFILSTDESFSNSTIIDLGPDGSLGRFVGESSGLSVAQHYFCTSFVDVDGIRTQGNVIELSTLSPGIDSFSPKLASTGDRVTILGSNYTDNVKVLFGESEASILEMEFESSLLVEVPPFSFNNFKVPVTVVDSGDTLIFEEPFEYISGKWTKKVDFINDNIIQEAVTIVKDGTLIYGSGANSENLPHPSFWNLDLNSLVWTQNDFELVRRGAFSGGNYFGSGSLNFGAGEFYANDLWLFDDDIVSVGTVPFRLKASIAHETVNNLFVLGGELENRSENLMTYRFNKSAEAWSVIGESPFPITNTAPHAAILNQLLVLNPNDNALWSFDLETFQWNYVLPLPVEVNETKGIAFNINDIFYIGIFERDNQIWELDLEKKYWKLKSSYPGSRGETTAGYGVYNNKLWLLRNPFPSRNNDDKMAVWSFDPNQI